MLLPSGLVVSHFPSKFDDLWMAQNGFMYVSPENTTAGDLLVSLGREGKLIYLLPDDSLQRAAAIFREHGISQLPVVENGRMIGVVQEITIVHAQHSGLNSRSVSLREVMARPLPQVDVGVLLEEVYRLLLGGNSAVTVTRDGFLAGLITRADLMDFYERVRKAEEKQ